MNKIYTPDSLNPPNISNTTIHLRFFDELNDFLPAKYRHKTFHWVLTGSQRLKELIDEMGIPASKIKLILVDGELEDLDLILQGGERISICPLFEGLDPKIFR